MPEPLYQEALDAFTKTLQEFVVQPVGDGLINRSFKATSKMTGESFLLQEINQNVFPDPAKVQYNYELLWKYLQSQEIFFFIPEPKYFSDDAILFRDSKGNYWRVFEFVAGTMTFEIAEKPSQAWAVAESFAEFTASFSDFNPEQLAITIPGFHDLSLRFNQFKDSLRSHQYERIQKAAELINELKEREKYSSFFDVMIESSEFPKRVMHHDAKISNVLFDEDSGEVMCPVDFDTVMPGYFFSDIGDMIRTMSCDVDETSTEIEKISIRKNYYESIIEGYLSVMRKFLTDAEKKYIHYSGIILIYMQALRFLTDYLNGDVYYKIIYPEQNFDRAINQLTLLKRLEEFLLKEYDFKV